MAQVDKRPLTLVCAPAGYGKTTLVVTWLATWPIHHIGWLSLDESDNDPVRFWVYVIAALQTAVPGVGESSLTLLQSPQPSPLPLTLTFLLNDLTALVEPLLLVLDDYHFITNQAIHESMAYWLDHLPAQVHLLLTSRADPPLPLARLRARAQMVEIREKDLRFTSEEMAEFMTQVMGTPLTAVQLQTLAERTEGWIAGVQLAGLAVEKAANLTEALQSFGGSHRHLVDYLTEEVLARQSTAIQDFLLQTAVFDRFCASLCEAALNAGERSSPISNLQSLLEYLDKANLFLIPLDNERTWYRYHHLFADLLRFRVAQTVAKSVQRQIHQRAAAWFARQQLWPEAIHHALAAGELEMAGQIIAQVAHTAVARGELASIQAWLAALPLAQLQVDPRLSLAQAWVDLFAGRLEAAEGWLQPVLVNEQAMLDSALSGAALAIRATLAFARQDAAQTIADSEQALARLPDDELPLRTLLAWHLAFTYRTLGETRQAVPLYHQVVAMSQRGGNFLINLSARRELADVLIGQGDLTVAQTMMAQLLAEADAHGWTHLVPVVGAHIALGEINYEWNRLDTAVMHGQTAVSQSQAEQMSLDAYGYALLARIYAAQGEMTAAAAAIQQAKQRVLQATHPQRRLLTLALISRFWLAQADVSRAGAWLPDGRDIPADPRHEVYARQQITQAYYFLARRQRQEAATLVAALLPAAEAAGRVRDMVELWLLRAQLGEGDEADTAVRRALALAEPAGLLRTFLDAGQGVMALLTRLQKQPDVPAVYLNRLLAVNTQPAAPPANRLLLEPLSERELEVLRLMSEGYSNREIADKLVFTVATAKKHAEHIYGKLGVNSRTQAIARARELGLVS
ncbi:MAG: hypothetical protein KJ069_21075 [Anaerolineae bacterium]|nr:hypothetical protein [Anaerolineae bacterium]